MAEQIPKHAAPLPLISSERVARAESDATDRVRETEGFNTLDLKEAKALLDGLCA
jgi:hypothetical protein